MRKPQSPPSLDSVLRSAESVMRLASPDARTIAQTANSKYLHWDKFRHYPIPDEFTKEEAWGAVIMSRITSKVDLPISFVTEAHKIHYTIPPCVSELLHRLDRNAGGYIGSATDDLCSTTDKERYLVSSLIEEAIASSQLEGATTTREVAKKMLRSQRKPRDKSEQMIVNNYNAIQEIRSLKAAPLSLDLICHIQEVITEGTLAKDHTPGRFRVDSDNVCVVDSYTGDVVHTPPPANEVRSRLKELCRFANQTGSEFTHPSIVASAIHFAIGYIHPFPDGNGRTARALFYWYMLKHGYWLFEYLPISRAILESPVKYARAYLYTETDSGDLTYFIHYNLRVIDIAVRKTHAYIARHQELMKQAKSTFRSMPQLNTRQLEVAYESVRDSASQFDVRDHMARFGVSRNTARADLNGLVDEGVLEQITSGNKHVYVPSDHLKKHVTKGRIVPKEKPHDDSTRTALKGLANQKTKQKGPGLFD